MEEILKQLGLTNFKDLEDYLEVELKDSDEYGKLYTKLERMYNINEDQSSLDSVTFITKDSNYIINLKGDFDTDNYSLIISSINEVEENI